MPDREQQREKTPPNDPATQPSNEVDEASEESFPASDPPSWSPTHAGSPEEHADGASSGDPDRRDADGGGARRG